MSSERACCFTCRMLEVRRAPDGTWSCWCAVDDEHLGKLVVTRRACAAHAPRVPGTALIVDEPRA